MSLLSNVSATVVQGQQVVGKEFHAENVGVSGLLNVSGDVLLSRANLLNDLGVVTLASNPAGALAYTVPDGVVNIIANNGANVITVTLPTPALNKGRTLIIKNLGTAAVSSASSNVVPLAGGAAGTALLAVSPAKGLFVCDGINWIQMLS